MTPGDAQVVMRLGVVRLEGEGLLKANGCLLGPAGGVKQGAQAVDDFRGAGIEGEGTGVTPGGLIELPLAALGIAQPVVGGF